MNATSCRYTLIDLTHMHIHSYIMYIHVHICRRVSEFFKAFVMDIINKCDASSYRLSPESLPKIMMYH